MGGHGGLNILPQKKWNVYNFDNREKVRKDEEAAAKEEQLKREQSRKRDSEFRLQQLRRARGIDPESDIKDTPPQQVVKPELNSVVESKLESKPDSNHINLFEGIKIFDPIEVVEKVREDEGNKKKKMKKEEVRVVGPEDEKYRLGYGVAGKGVKAPWYAIKPEKEVEEDENAKSGKKRKFESGEKIKVKKSVEELREERLKREKLEKERARALILQKRGSNGRYRRWLYLCNIKSLFLLSQLFTEVRNYAIVNPVRLVNLRIHQKSKEDGGEGCRVQLRRLSLSNLDKYMAMKNCSSEHLLTQKTVKKDKRRVCNDAVDLETAKTQRLASAEDLSIPSVIVMSANMGCSSCRDKVFRVLSKMTGFKEYTVDVRKKQVIIKGDVSFLWSTKNEAS